MYRPTCSVVLHSADCCLPSSPDVSAPAVTGHILDSIIHYYTAWLKAGSPKDGMQLDLGAMVPIVRGEHVFPPNAPARATCALIRDMIRQCDDTVLETAARTSRCCDTTIRVMSFDHCFLLPAKRVREESCIRMIPHSVPRSAYRK
jgi:hypothetical protein